LTIIAKAGTMTLTFGEETLAFRSRPKCHVPVLVLKRKPFDPIMILGSNDIAAFRHARLLRDPTPIEVEAYPGVVQVGRETQGCGWRGRVPDTVSPRRVPP
jgi:hypothetical protein